MHSETKTEIIVFSGLAAVVAAFWWASRQAQTAAQTLQSLPVGATDGSSGFNPQDSLSTPTVPTGSIFNIGGGGPMNIGGSLFNSAAPGGDGGCGCNTCADTGTGVTFGTPGALSAYLSANPGLIPSPEQISTWA